MSVLNIAPLSKIRNRLEHRYKKRAAEKHVRDSVQLLHGPAMTRLAEDEVALVILGRDVGYFLEHHIRHHLALGVAHIVFMDNGSTDDSVEIAKQFDNITIASCSADFRLHQGRIRFLANTAFLRGGWRLAIDPDELLDYPGSDRIDLPELTRRMTARGHTAMVAQMLDMVFDGPVSGTSGIDFAQAEQAFNRFSLQNVTSIPYHDPDLVWIWYLSQNRTSNPDIHVLFGGLRNVAFGETCCLTKHALFRMEKGVVPQAHPHVSTGVTCTDFSALLRHYKFAGDVFAREKKLLAENRISHRETRLRVAKLEQEQDMDLSRYAECTGPATAALLLDQGFLVASDAARDMLDLTPSRA